MSDSTVNPVTAAILEQLKQRIAGAEDEVKEMIALSKEYEALSNGFNTALSKIAVDRIQSDSFWDSVPQYTVINNAITRGLRQRGWKTWDYGKTWVPVDQEPDLVEMFGEPE